MSTQAVVCPLCGSNDTASIVYGLVDVHDALEQQSTDCPVEYGGCMVDDDSPEHHCNTCQAEF